MQPSSMRTGLGDAPEGSLLLCGDACAPFGALRRVRAVVVHSRASLLRVVWPLETVSDCVPCVEAGTPRQHRPNARQSLGEVLRFCARRRGGPLVFGVRAGLPCRWGRWPDSPLVSSLCEAWRVCALTINYKRKDEGLGVKTKVRHADWRRHCAARDRCPTPKRKPWVLGAVAARRAGRPSRM